MRQKYEIDAEESLRINFLKVLMCIFVLVIHAFSQSVGSRVSDATSGVYFCTFVLSRIICDCAVPVFILISSVLLYAKPFDWRANIKKKSRTLLIPYAIFNTLWIVLVFVKHIAGRKLGITIGDDVDLAVFSLFDWLDAYLGLTDDYKPILTVLWYVRDLFLLNLLAKPIQKLVDKFPVPVLALVLCVWLFDLPLHYIQAYSLVFFILGYYMVKYHIHFKDSDRFNFKAVAAVYAIVLLADVMLQREVTIVNRLFILVSVVFIAMLSKYCCRVELGINLIAPATFFIYLTHRFVYEVIQIALPNTMNVYLATYLVKPFVALVSMTGFYYLLKRYTPGLLAVLVGDRVRKRFAGSGNKT